MDKEMIERCARAALAHSGNDNPSQAQLDIAKRTVYPIIKAMREPTEAMITAGEDTGNGGIADNGSAETVRYEPDEVWQTMIDAITGAE